MTNNFAQVRKLSHQEKELKLLALMNSALEIENHRHEILTIMDKLALDRETIEKAFLEYNMNVHSHDNIVYKENAIRVVLHIHNLILGSWHQPRQQSVSELIALAQPQKVIDLGFGVPSRYVRELLQYKNYTLTLCDYQQPAVDFAELLLDMWSAHWREKIRLKCESMENIERCIEDYDLYVSLHSIEHVTNPTQCLKDYVRLSANHARFLVEIPIGPITPEHNIEWPSIAHAQDWFKSIGLNILAERYTKVNAEVDLFAEPHDYNYGGYLVLCDKL